MPLRALLFRAALLPLSPVLGRGLASARRLGRMLPFTLIESAWVVVR